ncbi:hypothetical protein GPECTOR_14g67 [Gonium pectorale]|uniref:Uncharacterized protein n=1 Tax=Gonium pectorale TaxID=33097 RepID=A0A150GML3_GONPE|nr:hypothetical protein GPECTOR_14g67 [Gonium pectorale]|eukprot:KXZ51083.1 hypothetical protein GPECTOR_14g67 [Gonium pectorale]
MSSSLLPAAALLASSEAADAEDLGGEYGDEGEEEGEDMAMLQNFMKQAMEKKRAAAAKAQSKVLEEFRANADKRIAAMEAEAKDSAAAARSAYTKTLKSLQDKVNQMEQLTQKYQQEMAQLWEQYNEEHTALENQTGQIKLAIDQRRQGVKRRIAALAQENEVALNEARAKADAVKGRAAKMPQLAKLLQSFM